MQFGTEVFWYQLPVTNRTFSIFEPVYGTIFLGRVFGADFWYVSHGYCSNDSKVPSCDDDTGSSDLVFAMHMLLLL